ncbi:MAG: hypothetical protein Q9M30_05000, partial [Mariprofundaceae bacterium]|nr:hypothetical protein [Mariprofundaceae bacterium]
NGDGSELNAIYIVGNSELATTSETIQASGKYNISDRWSTNGSINYDVTRKFTQQIDMSLTYTHPCWDITLEGHRTNRPTGTSTRHDIGASLLIGFKGLGSVGSSAN